MENHRIINQIILLFLLTYIAVVAGLSIYFLSLELFLGCLLPLVFLGGIFIVISLIQGIFFIPAAWIMGYLESKGRKEIFMQEKSAKIYTLVPIDQRETSDQLTSWIKPGQFRWAIFDRKQGKLFFGPADVHIHMTVAEESGVLRNAADYYRPGGNILGGFLACSKDGFYYFDPFSGTFPGTNDGVADAEMAMAEICKILKLPCKRYDDIPKKQRANKRSQAAIKNAYKWLFFAMLGMLVLWLLTLGGLGSRAEVTTKSFCSYCAKEGIAYSQDRDSEPLPPPGQCSYSSNGRHRWLRTIRSSKISDIWVGVCEGHSHSCYNRHKFLFPQILEKLQKFPDTERTWVLVTYNHILDTEENKGNPSEFFLRLVQQYSWNNKTRLQDVREIQSFLQEYKQKERHK